MRAYAFLGDGLLVYQRAVIGLLRERLGLDVEEPVTAELSELEALSAGDPALLFLCGLPYVRARDQGLPLEPLVAPVAMDAPDEPPGYHSVLMGRPALVGAKLAGLDGLALGINGYDSLSGWVLPVGMGLPLSACSSTTVTGGHLRSLEALVAGTIDCAPIDSMLLAAELIARPDLSGLPELAVYGPAPSPPVVLVGGDAALAARLTAALAALHEDPAGRAALTLGGMARLAPVADSTYDIVRTLDRKAAACTPS